MANGERQVTQDDIVNGILHMIHGQLGAANQQGQLSGMARQTVEFFRAIDWSQNWLRGLLVFHVLCFVLTILLHRRHDALSIYFFILLGLAAMTRPLNVFCQEHWARFASANYFDDSGLFIVSVYSFPLLFNGFTALVFILRAAMTLLVKLKRAQLKKQQRSGSKTKKD